MALHYNYKECNLDGVSNQIITEMIYVTMVIEIGHFTEKNIKFDDLDFWIGDMSKQEILKEVILPLINFEYRVSQLRQDILNTKQETDNMSQ